MSIDIQKSLQNLGQVWINGHFTAGPQATTSVMDHGFLYGDGVFEGIRSYNGRVMKLRSHLLRLYESARALRLQIPYSIEELEKAVRETLERNGRKDGYIRLVASRGTGEMGLNPFNSPKAGVFVVTCDIRLYPQEYYDNGLPIITSSVVRQHPASLSPRVKSLNYLPNILAKIEALDNGVFEAVMLNPQGLVAECTGDNIFVVRNGELLTPPLHAGILEGITRNFVIELAKKERIPFRESDLVRHDLHTADECFLTGTAAEVIPVSMIDKRPIGGGKPGPVTLRLVRAFRHAIAAGCPED